MERRHNNDTLQSILMSTRFLPSSSISQTSWRRFFGRIFCMAVFLCAVSETNPVWCPVYQCDHSFLHDQLKYTTSRLGSLSYPLEMAYQCSTSAISSTIHGATDTASQNSLTIVLLSLRWWRNRRISWRAARVQYRLLYDTLCHIQCCSKTILSLKSTCQNCPLTLNF